MAKLPRNTGRREGVGERGGSRRRFHGRVGRRGRERGRGGESELRERGRTRGLGRFQARRIGVGRKQEVASPPVRAPRRRPPGKGRRGLATGLVGWASELG